MCVSRQVRWAGYGRAGLVDWTVKQDASGSSFRRLSSDRPPCSGSAVWEGGCTDERQAGPLGSADRRPTGRALAT